MMKGLKTKHSTWLLIIGIIIIVLAGYLRLYKLDQLPPGLGRDEVSVGYNAYSINETGRDEHGRRYPLYFEAIGDQKLPVIIYATALSIKALGLTPFATRLPFALIGTMTVVLLMILIGRHFPASYTRRITLALLGGLLLAVNPWHLAHSRAVYEIILGTFFFTLGVLSLLESSKSKWWITISIVSFFLAFYSYSLTRILAPLLFLAFTFIYRSEIKKMPQKFLIVNFLLIVLFLLPFVLSFFDPGGVYGPQGAVIFSSSWVVSKITEFRSYLVSNNLGVVGTLFFNRSIMTFFEYGKNLMIALSPGFYFAQGSDVVGIGTNGHFYLIEFIPFVIGLLFGFKRAFAGNRFFLLLISWIILTWLSASLTVNPPYPTRTLFLVIPSITLIAFGWLELISFLKQRQVIKLAVITLIAGAYFWHTTHYFISYNIRFPVVYAKHWDAGTDDLFAYLKKYENDVDHIVITKPELSMYAFYLYYHQVPPDGIWNSIERYPPNEDGWTHGKKVGKYEFREIDWDNEFISKKSFIMVSQGDEFPDKQDVSHQIFYPTRHAVFAVGQMEIQSYPENPVAFRIWRYMYNPEEKDYVLVKE